MFLTFLLLFLLSVYQFYRRRIILKKALDFCRRHIWFPHFFRKLTIVCFFSEWRRQRKKVGFWPFWLCVGGGRGGEGIRYPLQYVHALALSSWRWRRGGGLEPSKTTANSVALPLYILLHLPPSVRDMLNDGDVLYVGAEIFVKCRKIQLSLPLSILHWIYAGQVTD